MYIMNANLTDFPHGKSQTKEKLSPPYTIKGLYLIDYHIIN